MRLKHAGLMAFPPLLLWSCWDNSTASALANEPGVLASGYWIPDGIAVIGEGDFLFADRRGALFHYANGEASEVRGLPPTTMRTSFGGVLDVILHPGFSQNRLVYIAYNNQSFDLSVARFELRRNRIENLRVIHQFDEFSIGSRIEWEDSSHFFLSFGVGGNPYPDPGPQDLSADVWENSSSHGRRTGSVGQSDFPRSVEAFNDLVVRSPKSAGTLL